MRFSMIFIAAAFLFLSSCKPAGESGAASAEASKPDMAQVKADIQAVENAWAAAQNAKDLNTLMAMYADDAVSMPEGAPTLRGKAAIQTRQEEEFAKAAEGLSSAYNVEEVFGDGDVVTEIGTGVTKDASGAVVRTGKYIAIWKKMDGKYLCIREIYNSDAPQK
jgi:uncharacterized protein (TIGR02246 family)